MPPDLRENNGPTSLLPLLRWAGGKQKLVGQLQQYLPEDISEKIYHEPFVGAGSLFFKLKPKQAIISDANEHLVEFYRHVRDYPELLYKHIMEHKVRSCEKYYYYIRDEYNESEYSSEQAARFIYLNKTCFNGIFRVNKAGKFNVPYGWKEPPSLPSFDQLIWASKILNRADIWAQPYEVSLENLGSSDFVYLDPPYPPLNGTSYFTHYTKERFNETDQIQLARKVRQLDEANCLFMMTNADTPFIRTTYIDYYIYSLSVVRWITCKSKRHRVSELVITNYPPSIRSFERVEQC